MEKLGEGLDSLKYWQDSSCTYVNALEGDYHKHRLTVIRSLIPEVLFSRDKVIFDFGCGDAVLFPEFIKSGARISGIDIAQEMIDLARLRLDKDKSDPRLVSLGGAEQLNNVESGSLDALLSFNVLAYLSDEEEAIFYQNARRIVKPGGFLIVTHSNELFDLFSLNRYTVEFMSQYIVADQYKDKLPSLLLNADRPESPILYNVRENPLAYNSKLKQHGFREIKQGFINFHDAPPPLLGKNKPYPDTCLIPDSDRWKLIFTCSTFGSCSIHE